MQMIYHYLYHCKPYYALHIILCIVLYIPLPYGYIHFTTNDRVMITYIIIVLLYYSYVY